jgi:hypothetical protein
MNAGPNTTCGGNARQRALAAKNPRNRRASPGDNGMGPPYVVFYRD